MKEQRARAREGVPGGLVVVEGLLREPFKKNMFTPDNVPEKGQWYFPDVAEMAEWTGSQAVWIEETMGASSQSLSPILGISWSHHLLRFSMSPLTLSPPDSPRPTGGIRPRIEGHTHRAPRRGHFAQQPHTVYLYLVLARAGNVDYVLDGG